MFPENSPTRIPTAFRTAPSVETFFAERRAAGNAKHIRVSERISQ